MRKLTPEERQLVEANTRIALKCVGSFISRNPDLVELKDELISEAYATMVCYTPCYRPEIARYSTYMFRCMWMALGEYLRNRGVIRVPKKALVRPKGDLKPQQQRQWDARVEAARRAWSTQALGRTAARDMDCRRPSGDSAVVTDAEEESRRDALLRWYRGAIETLDDRERDVMVRRSRNETLASIGRSYGLSKERIRQIQRKAMDRVKAMAQEQSLIAAT